MFTYKCILKQKTQAERYILECIDTKNVKKLDNKKIVSILHTILCWEEINGTIVPTDKNILSLKVFNNIFICINVLLNINVIYQILLLDIVKYY